LPGVKLEVFSFQLGGFSLSSKGKGLVADLLGRQVSLQVSARMEGLLRSLVGVDPRVKKGEVLIRAEAPFMCATHY